MSVSSDVSTASSTSVVVVVVAVVCFLVVVWFEGAMDGRCGGGGTSADGRVLDGGEAMID